MDLFPVFGNSSLRVCVIHLRIFLSLFCTFGILLNFVDFRIFLVDVGSLTGITFGGWMSGSVLVAVWSM